MRVSEDLLDQTQAEVLQTLTFGKKFELAKDHLESSDKDLRLAIINDIFNSGYELKDIIDFIKHGGAIDTEKYLDEVLTNSNLI